MKKIGPGGPKFYYVNPPLNMSTCQSIYISINVHNVLLFKAILNDDRNEMTCEILIAWTNDFILCTQ